VGRPLFVCMLVALFGASFVFTGLRAEQKAVGRIDVSLRLQPGASGGPGRVLLDITLTNDSASMLFFAEQSRDWDYQLDITGPAGSPLRPTNYGCRVLRQPREILRNIGRQLEPGEKDHIESVELNRLYILDRVGAYRVVARRRVWQTKPAYSSQPVEFFAANCRNSSDCYDVAEATSAPFSFNLTTAYPDVSPPANRGSCPEERGGASPR
jgi:hypothetical protein